MPRSRTVSRTPSSSTSRVHSDHSVCSAVTGCTACARRIVSGAASEMPEVPHLAGPHDLGEGAPRLLDRHRTVDPVLVVEVDVVDPQPLEGGVDGPADVVGAAVDADPAAVLAALVAELGGQHDLVAPAGDRLAHQLLVGERPVHVGGVEEGHAEVQGAVDRGDRLRLVARAVELGHAHAAEAECGHLEGGHSGAERAGLGHCGGICHDSCLPAPVGRRTRRPCVCLLTATSQVVCRCPPARSPTIAP